jgi:hypothetical protein
MRRKPLWFALGFGAFGVLVGFYFVRILHPVPPPLTATASSSNSQVVNITLSTWGAIADANPADTHPNWVGYYPTTMLYVPAHSTVHMEIDQEDSATGLRNPYLGLVRGVCSTDSCGDTPDNAISLNAVDTKKTYTVQAVGADGSLALAGGGNVPADQAGTLAPAHTFTIPDLGISVPLSGVSNADGEANKITFSFKVPGPGIYHWQCFVPCGAGTLYGNGGPMQTLGYMDGELVVS